MPSKLSPSEKPRLLNIAFIAIPKLKRGGIMLGIGFLEILVIALVGFIVLGPKQLPIAMRKAAQYYRKFLNLKEDFNYQLLHAELEEPKKTEDKDKNHG